MISVIVAVYNIEKYIARCMESLCRQTYQDLEIIVVVDGSTDGSEQICREYARKDSRIRVIRQENKGLGGARNTGIEQAQGEYIAFVDGDDWVEPQMYETMVSLAQREQADLVACRYRCIYKDHETDGSTGNITVFSTPYAMLVQYLKEDEAYPIQHAAWNKLYTRAFLENERFPEGKWYEDIVFSAKVLCHVKKGVYVDTALYDYVCEREGSIMNAGLTERIFTDQIPAYVEKEEFLDLLPEREAVALHRYFFYKRLLIYYTELGKKENRALKKYRKKIVILLRERKGTFRETFSVSTAKKTDRFKLKIFMVSPVLYSGVMWANQKWILPYKLSR